MGGIGPAGVERFVFVSALSGNDAVADLVPLFAAKRATEQRLQRSAMRAVIVRPAAFQEVWLGPTAGIRPDERRAAAGARALRRRQPELASGLGIAVSMDVSAYPGSAALTALGIQPRAATEYIAGLATQAPAAR